MTGTLSEQNRTMHIQIAMDCSDPHALAKFYADGFGYEVPRGDGSFIRRLIDDGLVSQDELLEVDGELVFATVAACIHPDPSFPRLYFQQVPEAKTAKNRVHLDFQFGSDQARDEAVARLLGLGAEKLWEGQQGPGHEWVTMIDPEGNEFCVSD